MGTNKHFGYAARVDANQEQIVSELRKLDFDVDIVSRLKGLYDIVVSGPKFIDPGGLAARLPSTACSLRVEIKNGDRGLNKSEQEYHGKQINRETLIVARSAEDVLRWFGWHPSKIEQCLNIIRSSKDDRRN